MGVHDIEISIYLARAIEERLSEDDAKVRGVRFLRCNLSQQAALCIARGITKNSYMHFLAIQDDSLGYTCENILLQAFLMKNYSRQILT